MVSGSPTFPTITQLLEDPNSRWEGGGGGGGGA